MKLRIVDFGLRNENVRVVLDTRTFTSAFDIPHSAIVV
jgi:hypothetical protein